MTNYREILRLKNLGLNNTQIAAGCSVSRTTVLKVVQRAAECSIGFNITQELSDNEIAKLLFPSESNKPVYTMPDYEYIHREMAKSGVTLTLLWLEYCDKCRDNQEMPYQFTQFKKYYRDFVVKTKATMHINRKPGEIMEVDWAGQTASIIDTDTGEIIPAYVFVAVLSYSASIRNQQFLSFKELNDVIKEKLKEFNNKPFQKKNGSRATLFLEEKPFLLPLPQHLFELATWKIATVGYNYHISVEHQNYSVPFEYIKQIVDVRMTRNIIEVFFENNRICSHQRLYGRMNQYSTTESHMPPDHQKYVQWNSERFRKWAAKIGKNTTVVIESILTSNKVEQQGYKSCMALLKLADKYSVERLETACTKVLTYTLTPEYKNIQIILQTGQDKINESNIVQTQSSGTEHFSFTRGAEYYKRSED